MEDCKFEADNSVFDQVLASFKEGSQTVNEAHAEKNQIMRSDVEITREEAMKQVADNNPEINLVCAQP